MTKPKQENSKEVARIVLLHGSDMSARDRHSIVAWLRRTAKFIEKHNDELAPRFTARYHLEGKA